MFYFTYFPPGIIWLICGTVIGFFLRRSTWRGMLAMAAFILIGVFIGGYYAWFAGVKAQANQEVKLCGGK